MPSQRSESGCVSGNAPQPMIVVVTGICVASANLRNSSLALPLMMPPPQYKHRALGFLDQPDDFIEREIARFVCRIVAADLHLFWKYRLGHGLLNVLWHIHHHRPGPAGLRDIKRFFDDARNVVHVGDQIAVLHDRQRHAEEIGFLKPAFADHRLRHLAR